MSLEWLLVAAACALGVKLVGLRERHAPWLLTGMILSGGAAALATTSARSPTPSTPVTLGRAGFATSNACRSCHAAEYQSWHRSYHRSMTQLASVDSAAAPELRQGGRLRVESGGRTIELFSRGGQLRARLPDPGVTSAAPREAYSSSLRVAPDREVPIELLTGSHHQQAFWVAGARAGELRAVPAVYLIAEGRLIPRKDAFLTPPDALEQAVRWNSNCIQCHAVAGAPEHDAEHDAFTSSVAELGIACEACHGAALEHVRAMQNPWQRYQAQARPEQAPGIVNPARLPSERSSEVCGRCHSYFFPKQEADWWLHGFSRSFEPGGELARAQLLLSPERLQELTAPELEASADSLFYADGTIRVAGREYNGLVLSPCYERGQGTERLGCTSCHSLHRSDPDDQLAEGKQGNGACTKCHADQGSALTQHTHHAGSSSGSLCYNCHMPQTTYALLGAVRSHRIDSPAFDARSRDRPNACSLCHLERSEAWAAARAREWYGSKPSFTLERSPGLEGADTPAGASFALAGDAAVRAITAAALGRLQSGEPHSELRGQLLRELAADPYAAVRRIAERAVRDLPQVGAARAAPALSPELVAELKALRDNRPVTIAE